jgi:hypothetical protein
MKKRNVLFVLAMKSEYQWKKYPLYPLHLKIPLVPEASSKITTSKLAKKLGKKTDDLLAILVSKGYLNFINNKRQLTSEGKQAGGEHKKVVLAIIFMVKSL